MIKIFSRFYNAMAGPTLILNTTQFGHADLLDELEAGANEVFCNGSNKNEDVGETKAKYPYLDFFWFFILSNISDYKILQGWQGQRQVFLQVPSNWKRSSEHHLELD